MASSVPPPPARPGRHVVVGIAGLAFAVIAELWTIVLLAQPAAFLLPVVRVGSLAWFIAAAALLHGSRPGTTTTHERTTP